VHVALGPNPAIDRQARGNRGFSREIANFDVAHSQEKD
jgi:hypothetical protein